MKRIQTKGEEGALWGDSQEQWGARSERKEGNGDESTFVDRNSVRLTPLCVFM